jgi:hypothetical protein
MHSTLYAYLPMATLPGVTQAGSKGMGPGHAHCVSPCCE